LSIARKAQPAKSGADLPARNDEFQDPNPFKNKNPKPARRNPDDTRSVKSERRIVSLAVVPERSGWTSEVTCA